MPDHPFADLDATAIVEHVVSGQVSPTEVARTFLDAIADTDESLGAFVHVDRDGAIDRAQAASGPGAGVPFAMKDVAPYPGMPWTMGARVMAGNVADTHSAYSRRIDEAGLVTLGKTATSELGLLGSTETRLHGTTVNPWAPGISAGGSSGGAAAAVAAGLLPVAHASDAGGSIRGPASMSGIFGFKPSNGRTLATAPSGGGLTELVAEHVVSRSVRDSAKVLALTERRDADAPYPPIGEVTVPLAQPLRIGTWTSTLSGEDPEPEVAAAVDDAIKLLEDLGHHVERIAPPDVDGQELSDAFFTVAGQSIDGLAQMLAPVLGRDPGPDELEPFTLDLLAWYRSQPPDAVATAATAFATASDTYEAAVAGTDVALTPTLAIRPWPLGHLAPDLPREVLLDRTRRAVGYTPIHNVVGAPAMSVPLTWTEGLPIGVHLAAAPGADALLLQLALQLEAARPWHHRRPIFPTQGA